MVIRAHSYVRQAAAPQGGFTLIELMTVLVVLAVLLGIGAPAFTELIRSNRLVSEVNTLRVSLAAARAAALAQRAPVTVCPSTDGVSCASTNEWNTGYIAFVDFDGDGAFDGLDDQYVVTETVQRDQLTLRFDQAAQRVLYDAQGASLNFSGTFTVCDARGEASDARAIIIAPSGQVRSAVDSDADGIRNGLGGVNVACP
jgi:type IV fimbrial biogenesis protein FimT